MGYAGQTVVISLGDNGLKTDAPMTSLPPSALIKANNVSLYSGKIEKAKGSIRFNTTALSDAVVACFDWWPTSQTQRTIALTADGKIYRDTGDRTFTGGASLPSIEVQKITLNYPPVGGSVKLNFNGVDSTLISSTATTAQIQTAVRTIPALSGATVTGNFANGFRVNMVGTSGDQPMLTSNTNTLTSEHIQKITFSAVPTAGTWQIQYGFDTTSALVFNATALAVESALRLISGLEAVTVSGDYSSGFTITLVDVGAPVHFTTSTSGLVASGTPVTLTNTAIGTVIVTVSEVSKGKTGLGVLTTDTHLVQGGQEESGQNKKLFIFTGTSQIQVLDGDAGYSRDILKPSPDWANGNYPTYGIIYQGRLCVLGCPTNPHLAYFSTAGDHENFLGEDNVNAPPQYLDVPPIFQVYPGEADGLITAQVFRGTLLLYKEPYGVYAINGQDPSIANWSVTKFSDSFGVQSPHAVLQILTDVVTANSNGSYTSLTATDQFGDFEAGDILSLNQVEEYIRSVFNPAALPYITCVYYPEKKAAYFTGQSSLNDERNQMLVIDFARGTPRFYLDTKERPNCLALRRDAQKIQRPMYGAKDGYIWLMDQPTYNRNNSPYLGEFQTAYTDLGGEAADKNKIFEFLEVNYVATGNNDFLVDVFVDGDFKQTLTFTQNFGAKLDEFILDVDLLAGDPSGSRNRKRLLSCTGVKISFRVYNNQSNEGFKIERFIVGFRMSAEQVYKGQT